MMLARYLEKASSIFVEIYLYGMHHFTWSKIHIGSVIHDTPYA